MPGAARRAPAQCARRVHAHVRCMSCTTDNLRNLVLDKITTLAGSDWTESLEADGLKDGGVHHRAFDGQRSFYRCDSKTGYSTSCGCRPPTNARLSAR